MFATIFSTVPPSLMSPLGPFRRIATVLRLQLSESRRCIKFSTGLCQFLVNSWTTVIVCGPGPPPSPLQIGFTVSEPISFLFPYVSVFSFSP